MGITVANKEISTTNIYCGETFDITLSLIAEPDIMSNPTDIVLMLDRSTSMAGSPLANLKNGARKFIDIIDEATDSEQDGHIGHGSHIAIVSFASTATQDTQLTTSVADLKDAVNNLTAYGYTNHADAFTKAIELFDMSSDNQKVLVMFTDGETTVGGNPSPVATAAKEQGIIIYAIGLSGREGVDEQALRDWASDPDSAYVAITPDDEELEELFEDLARNISKPGATDIVIDETVNPCFRIEEIYAPTAGSAQRTGQTSLRWTIEELGVSGSEGAALRFAARHTGECTGTMEVNDEITYSDNEDNVVSFPSPAIRVDCGLEVMPESCPEPVELTIDGGEDSVELDAGSITMSSLGRILQLDVLLRNVAPNRRVALGVILTELDAEDEEYPRGMKTLTVPAHNFDTCRDMMVRCIKFVLPEDLDVSGGVADSICNARRFRARFIAHYIDNDFACCEVNI